MSIHFSDVSDTVWAQQKPLSSAHPISYIPPGTSELAQPFSSDGYGRDPREQLQLHEHLFSLGCISFVSIILAKARHMGKPNINDTYSFYGSEQEKVTIIEQSSNFLQALIIHESLRLQVRCSHLP